MRDNKIPGMSVLISREGQIFYQRAFGSREWRGGKPATIDTLYGIASITKSMTCVAILQLYQEGKLNIHDPVSNYLPVKLGFDDNPITIHHLMCHASGIPSLHDYVFPIVNEELTLGELPNFPMGNWEDFWFHINDAKNELISLPGSKFYYFNGGFTILGQIIEKVSEIPYERYVKEYILLPLEMNRSTFSREELEKDEDASMGYTGIKDKNTLKRKPRPHLSGPFNSGAGGLNSTVLELTNYLQFHLNVGEFNGKNILKEDLIREMQKPHNTNLTTDTYLIHKGKTAYGYGWRIVEDYHGYTLISHAGGSGVSGGFIAFLPELNVTYAQLYNIGFLTRHLMDYALLLLIGKDPDEELVFIKRRRHYKKITGKYEAYKKIITMSIIEKSGMLYLEGELDEKFSFPLIPHTTDPEVMNFYIITPFGKMDVNFTQH
ncbi:MAG: serine hydrolase, partial [Candidatus Hodarchaeales archaeon]